VCLTKLLVFLQTVTVQQIRDALKQYILPIFDPETSVAAIASAPTRAQEIADQLKAVGYDVETRELDLGSDDDGSGSESGSETGSEGTESESEGPKGRL
jgi:hypothetical protein